MQQIYGPGNASNILLTAQKRLVRPVYAQTQGFPYAAILSPSLRDTEGNFRAPKSGDTSGAPTTGQAAAGPLTYAANTFTLHGSVVPGTVLVKVDNSEAVVVASGANAAEKPMGLLGQWLGGSFDNVGQTNQVGVWMGPDSTYDLLAPAFDATSVGTALASTTTAGNEVLLYADTDGRLGVPGTVGSRLPVARVILQLSSAVLRIQLLI